MSNTTDSRQADVERAVKAAAQRLLSREIGISEAVAAVAVVLEGPKEQTATPRECAAAASRSYRERIVAEIVRLEREGRSRDAISIVVDDYAADKRDPVEVQSLARKFRRWRGAERRTHVRSPASG